MYIENIEMSGFRCFEQSKCAFYYQGKGAASTAPRLPNVNLVLGNNGTGKTTVLRGLALAVLGTILQSAGFRPYMLVRRSGPRFDQQDPPQGKNAVIQAKIQLHHQDSLLSGVSTIEQNNKLTGSVTAQAIVQRKFTTETIVSTARVNTAKWEPLFDDFSPAFFMIGYGASRRTGSAETYDPSVVERARSPRYQRIAGLFEESITLIPISRWWSTMRKQGRMEAAIELINGLLPNGIRINIEESVNGNEVLFAMREIPLPFQALSDGYRTLIGFVADLLYNLAQVAPPEIDLTSLHGVVLIDELDLFLHPAWQRIIVDKLAKTFPNLQFFITTHSPILTGTLQYNNIIITEQDEENGEATLQRSHERVFGLSADQVLGSPYFGLTTSRAPAAEDRLRELAQRSSKGDEKATEDYMRLLAEGFSIGDITTIPNR